MRVSICLVYLLFGSRRQFSADGPSVLLLATAVMSYCDLHKTCLFADLSVFALTYVSVLLRVIDPYSL